MDRNREINKIHHGGDIYGHEILYDLSVNMNPAGPPDILEEALKKAGRRIGQYPEYENAALRKMIGRCFGLESESIVCGNGASELISVLGRLFSGKRLLLSVPSFVGYERAFSESEITFFETDEAEGYTIDDRMAEMLDKVRPDVVLITNPNNPTGRLTGKETLIRLLEKAKRQNIFVIVDESFIELCTNGDRHSLIDIMYYYDNLIIIRSVTKSFAAAGIRLGYLMSKNSSIIAQIKIMLPEWNISVFAEEVGKAIFTWEGREAYLRRSRAYISEQRRILENAFKEKGIEYIPSDCNFVAFRHDTDLYARMLNKRILIRDCSDYRSMETGWYRAAVTSDAPSIVFLHSL